MKKVVVLEITTDEVDVEPTYLEVGRPWSEIFEEAAQQVKKSSESTPGYLAAANQISARPYATQLALETYEKQFRARALEAKLLDFIMANIEVGGEVHVKCRVVEVDMTGRVVK